MKARRKILIIDDDNDLLTILSYVCERLNMEPILHYDMPVFAEIETINPDLVFVDHWLPNGFGGDLCRAIKSHSYLKHIPVILMSAVLEINEVAGDCGADDILTKPFDLDQVAQLILHHLNNSLPPKHPHL